MKILSNDNPNLTEFKNIKSGEVFKTENNYVYMRIANCYYDGDLTCLINAVALKNGAVAVFDDSSRVESYPYAGLITDTRGIK